MNWSKRRRYVVRSTGGFRQGQRKPVRLWHVYDRAYNFALVSNHRFRHHAREEADILEAEDGVR